MRSAGALRPVVVLALGTNGPIERTSLEEVRRILGPDRELIVVNAQAPRGWIPGVNAELSSFALVYRNVELANWHDAIQPYLSEMARDQIHFGPIGAGVFATAVGEAVERLADAATVARRVDRAGRSAARVASGVRTPRRTRRCAMWA